MPVTTHYSKTDYTADFANQLSRAHEKKTSKVLIFFRRLYNKLFADPRKLILRQLLTQEHLEYDIGSQTSDFIPDLSKHLKNYPNPSEGCKKLMNLLEQMDAHPTAFYQRQSDRLGWINSTHEDIHQLKEGESYLLDCSSSVSEHAMLMEITKVNDRFTINFYNTGAGIDENIFHPSITKDNQKQEYQVCAVIEGVRASKISHRFIRDLFRVIDKGPRDESQQAESESGAFGETLSIISCIYEKLSELGPPTDLSKDYDQNRGLFRKEQLGSSCSASVLWALAHSKLTPDELSYLKQNMLWSYLIRGYEEFKSGINYTTANKILLLEQISKLNGSYEKRKEKPPEVLNQIRKELQSDTKAATYIKKNKKMQNILNRMAVKKEKLLKLPLISVDKKRFSSKKEQVHFKIGRISENDINNYSFSINTKGEVSPMDLESRIYLTHLYVILGDEQKAEMQVKRLISELNNVKNRSEFNISQETKVRIRSLAEILSLKESNRKNIARIEFFNSLADLIKYKKIGSEHRFEYNQLNAGKYLADNTWVKGIKSLDELADRLKR